MPEWLDQYKRVLNGEEISASKDKMVRDDGSVQWMRRKLIPWYIEPGEIGGMIMFNSDITSEVSYTEKLEKEVQNRTKQLEIAINELESFSYSISHDLRAPLRSINGFSDILIEDYSEALDDNGNRLLNIVRDSASKMGRLIDDILHFSRLGKKSIEFRSMNMSLIFKSVIDDLNFSYVGKEPSVMISDLHSAMGDPALIKQVVVNLITNAYKYSANKDKISVIVHSKIQNDLVLYSVKDNGVGFDTKYHDKLFGVFQRLHSDAELKVPQPI